jgi:hypothetical protein
MSVSTYSSQVSRLEKEIAALQKKAGQERERAAKERQAAKSRLSGISRHTSDSQRLSKEKDAARYEERAAKHDVKAAGLSDQAARKGEQLQRARVSMQRAQASEDRKSETKRKQALDREKRDLAEIERRRRQLQTPPSFEPQTLLRGQPIVPRGRPLSLGGDLVQESDESAPRFDVCLSFAGEQRAYVEMVAHGLKSRNYEVFYDADEQVALWGKNLMEHFEYIYSQASRACLMFISKEYASKPWTTHERRSALARALEEDEYVLPARFDDTELPGLPPTVGYIDLAEVAPESLVELLAEKLGTPAAQVGR